MNRARLDCGGLSRRMLFTNAALALSTAAAAATVSRAMAQQQITQASVGYQATPKGDQRCSGCVNFQPPSGCKFVQGTISPNGWCQLFSPKT